MLKTPTYLIKINLIVVFALALSLIEIPRASGQTYANVKAVHDDRLSNTRYHTDVRPIVDQYSTFEVEVGFMLVSIVEVNDVTQSFVCNGFLLLTWDDEIVPWNETQYDDVSEIHPHPRDIWRPRLVLLNTLGARDLFEDDASPVTIFSDGFTSYIPGGIFEISCDLNLQKYPFDDQECTIQMLPMGYKANELVFEADEEVVGLDFFKPNGEWELTGTAIRASNMPVARVTFSSFEITFQLSRRPTFFVLNILLPVVLLSLLNMLVFTIPAESGEKVGYGITVLLALSVFLSIVSGMLPKASDTVPSVTIYLFMLLIISVLTVIDAIVIVFIYNQEEKEVKTMRSTRQYSKAAERIGLLNRVIGALRPTRGVSQSPPMEGQAESKDSNGFKKLNPKINVKEAPGEEDVEENKEQKDGHQENDGAVNKYKMIGKYIDGVSLVVFLMIWLIVTCWFFVSVLT